MEKKAKNDVIEELEQRGLGHPLEWWDEPAHPERNQFLRHIVGERSLSEESEDHFGNPIYIPERCPKF